MKKSTFKKAGVAVLSMAMLLSMGAVAVPAYAANAPSNAYMHTAGALNLDPEGVTGNDHTLTLPKSPAGYTIYQVASAQKANGIWEYTLNTGTASASDNQGFGKILKVEGNKIVTTKQINNPYAQVEGGSAPTEVIPEGVELRDIPSHANQSQILANALKRIAEDQSSNLDAAATTTANTDDTVTFHFVSGYYLVLANDDASEPILVDLQEGNFNLPALKRADAPLDKSITDVANAHNETNAADYISTSGNTALAGRGATITYEIDTKFPTYLASAETINQSDSNLMTKVNAMDNFTIVDEAEETLEFIYDVDNGAGDNDVYDGIVVYVQKTVGTPIDITNNATYDVAQRKASSMTDAGAYLITKSDSDATSDFTIRFSNVYVLEHADKEVKVVYKAVLSEDAPDISVGNDKNGNHNDVTLTYSNNYDTGKGTWKTDGDPDPENVVTKEDEADVYTTKWLVNKLDENQKPLAGASFDLQMQQAGETKYTLKDGVTTYDATTIAAGTQYTQAELEAAVETYNTANPGSPITLSMSDFDSVAGEPTWVTIKSIAASDAGTTMVDPDTNTVNTEDETKNTKAVKNVFEFTGLLPGIYQLVETSAPQDYQPIDPITFVINSQQNGNGKYDGTYTFRNSDNTAAFPTELDVQNFQGQTLPGTGGIGTYLFTFGGAAVILMAGAMFVLYMKKREVEE